MGTSAASANSRSAALMVLTPLGILAVGSAWGEWTPADALGYSKMLALTGIFYQRAGANKT